jgi:hypothetical protein
VKVTGTGVTDLSLKKNLNLQSYFTFTNANIQIVSPKVRGFLEPVAAALRVPDILNSPINWVTAALVATNGNLTIGTLGILSEAFYANTSGNVPMADILTNSPINMPVNFQLRRSLAEKVYLIGKTSYLDQKYVSLPSFINAVGTIGNPGAKIDTAGVAKLIAKVTLENLGGSGAGGGLGGIANQFLGGNQAAPPPGVSNKIATNAPPAATAPQTKPTVNSILNGFLTPSAPSTGSTNAPAATNAPSAAKQILDIFNRSK